MRLHPLHQPDQGVAGNPPRRVASALDAPRPPANGGESPDGGPAVLVGLPKAHEKRKPAASSEGSRRCRRWREGTKSSARVRGSRLRFRRAADPATSMASSSLCGRVCLVQVAKERQHLADNSLGVPIFGGSADEQPDA